MKIPTKEKIPKTLPPYRKSWGQSLRVWPSQPTSFAPGGMRMGRMRIRFTIVSRLSWSMIFSN